MRQLSARGIRIALVTTIVTAIGACVCLAGCGQKGNLYLPNQKKKVPTTAPQPDTPTPPAAPPATPPAVPSQPDTSAPVSR